MSVRAGLVVLALSVGLAGGVLEFLGLDEADPGILARALASTDSDIDGAIEALEAGDLEAAKSHLDAAEARRGERPEIHYDRGLVLLAEGDKQGAQTAFQHGTESEHVNVRASSHYELGNLAMIAEDWELAIAQYTDCLRALPTHENAKWNLELALQRKREQEEQEEQEKQDQENQDQQDQENQDQQDQENQDQQDQENQDQQDQENQDQQDQENQDQQDQENQDQQEQQDQEQQDQEQQEQQQQDQQQQEDQQQAQPKPVESGDLDAALDELDRQDAFMFGRPRGSRNKVEKDW